MYLRLEKPAAKDPAPPLPPDVAPKNGDFEARMAPLPLLLPAAPLEKVPPLGPKRGVRGSVASPPRRFCSLASEAISESSGLLSSCNEAATRATERSLGRRLPRRVTAFLTTLEDSSEEERERLPPCPNGDPVDGPVEGERGIGRDVPAPPVDEELS